MGSRINPITHPKEYWTTGTHSLDLNTRPSTGLFSYFQRSPVFKWSIGQVPSRLAEALGIKTLQDFKVFIDVISQKLDNSKSPVQDKQLIRHNKQTVTISYINEGDEGEVYKISIPGREVQPIAWKRHYPFPYYKNILSLKIYKISL